MKRFYQLSLACLMALCCLFSLAACGGSDDKEDPIVSTPIVQRSCSLAEGAEVIYDEVTQITLSYNAKVVPVPGKITLNGSSVDARNGNTKLDVVIPVTLSEGTSYTLDVPAGAIVKEEDNNSAAPAFRLTFRTKEAAPTPDTNLAAEITKKLGWGWNLGNHFDTSSGQDGKPTQWGYWDNAKPTADLYNNLKAAGVSTLRMCATWGNYQTEESDWTIQADYLAEVKQNLDLAEAAGLNVILNLHHDEYWLDIKNAAKDEAKNTAIKHRIERTWQQLAETFKDKGEFLFFESFNEVQDGGWGWGDNRNDGGKQYRTLNEWNQLVVNTIRATGGNNATRWIGVPGYASSPSFVLDNNFQLPEDPAGHIMVSVHYYDPTMFTLSPEDKGGYSEWGHTAAAGTYDKNSNEAHVKDVFSKLQQKFINNNIPVYIGEYGCVMHKNDRSNLFREYYLEYVCRAAHTYGMPLIIWDNNSKGGGNEHHGYFNHNDGTYLNDAEQLVKTMINAATSDDPAYTLDDVYNKAPK